jgi:hypothetical protein
MFIILFGVLLIGLLGVFVFFYWDRGFKNVAHIARQTGENIDDVIWIKTRFKVVYHNGIWKIHFRHLREKTLSVEGKFWTKFGKSKILQMSETEWKSRDMTKLVQRGLYLYETSEGVFYPMKIEITDKKAGLRILDQDNKLFLINEIANIDMLTKDNQRMMVTIIAIIVGIVILGAVFFGGMYFLNKSSTEGMRQNAAVCSSYTKEILNLTMSPSNNFIGNIPMPGG